MKKKIAIGCVAFVLALTSVYFYVAYGNSKSVEKEIKKLIILPINEETMEKFIVLEKKISGIGPAAKFFIDNYSEYDVFKQDSEKYLTDCANDVSEKISALEPLKEIESFDHYFELHDEIEAIEIDETTVFGKTLKQKVSNYSDLEKYKTDLSKLLKTYEVKCNKCGGTGQSTCDYCNGRGKKTVTWYSEGDWGSQSYSSYDCTQCGGDGKTSCSNCIDGYCHDFG